MRSGFGRSDYGIGKQLHQGIHFLVIKRVYEVVLSGSLLTQFV